jgi:hypothetical protein
LRWHRQGFRLFWKHKSLSTSNKSKVTGETIALIKDMAKNNRLWGAERIRGELLKLDIHVCKRTIQHVKAGAITSRLRIGRPDKTNFKERPSTFRRRLNADGTAPGSPDPNGDVENAAY